MYHPKPKYVITILLIFGFAFFRLRNINAQSDKTSETLNYAQFMENVKNNNINYIAEQYNADIAWAQVQAAKVFPDPELSLGAADNQERKLQMGYNIDAGVDYTLELGGKRKARIRLAQSEAEMTEALLLDFFRNLRADATLAYLYALYQKQAFEIRKMSYRQMAELARADSIRHLLGAINETDARQSRLEADMMLNDLIQSEAESRNASLQLQLLQGDGQTSLFDSIAGTLTYLKRDFLPSALTETALDNRADLLAALKMKEVSQRNLRLAKANRAIDLGLNFGVSRNAEVRNEIAPAPAFTAVTAGISIPLKFSNFNKGEIRAGQLAAEQSEANCRAAELQIITEVAKAYNLYTAARRRAEQFDSGYLANAESIFVNKKYGYERGETSLLEVLNAQRTFNDVREKYYETLYGCAAALVELERACGIWDMEKELGGPDR